MRKVLVDIPFRSVAEGVRKRHRVSSRHDVLGRVACDVPSISSDMLDGTIRIRGGRVEFGTDLPVWSGRVLRPLSASDGERDVRGNTRCVPVLLTAMPGLVEGTVDGRTIWDVPATDMRTRRQRPRDRIGQLLVGATEEHFREILRTDEEERRADALVDAGDLVCVDGILHTGRFEPVLRFGGAGGAEWLPVRPGPPDFGAEWPSDPVRLDKAAAAIARGCDGFGGVSVSGDLSLVAWRSRDLDAAASSALFGVARAFLASTSSTGVEESRYASPGRFPMALADLGGMARCLAAASDVFLGVADAGSAVADAIEACEAAGLDRDAWGSSAFRPGIRSLREVADRIAVVEAMEMRVPDEDALLAAAM